MYRTLISTDTLASHLDGSWVIVDCRYDLKDERWGPEQYRSSHIPGAVHAQASEATNVSYGDVETDASGFRQTRGSARSPNDVFDTAP